MNKTIARSIPVAERLAQVSEECAELIQACLKLIRVFSETNPAAITEEQAFENLYEEVADVQLCLEQLSLPWSYIDEIKRKKEKRWVERLLNAEKAEKA